MAREDSDWGSWKPPGARLLATGMPKIAAAMKTNTPTARMRRGALMASRATRCSILAFLPRAFALARAISAGNINANLQASNNTFPRYEVGARMVQATGKRGAVGRRLIGRIRPLLPSNATGE